MAIKMVVEHLIYPVELPRDGKLVSVIRDVAVGLGGVAWYEGKGVGPYRHFNIAVPEGRENELMLDVGRRMEGTVRAGSFERSYVSDLDLFQAVACGGK